MEKEITKLLINSTSFNNHIHCFGEVFNNFIGRLESLLCEEKLVLFFEIYFYSF